MLACSSVVLAHTRCAIFPLALAWPGLATSIAISILFSSAARPDRRCGRLCSQDLETFWQNRAWHVGKTWAGTHLVRFVSQKRKQYEPVHATRHNFTVHGSYRASFNHEPVKDWDPPVPPHVVYLIRIHPSSPPVSPGGKRDNDQPDHKQ
ncbi:hypothetical protein J3F84DRAFT_390371 [Trichoderma pleuroticola]